MEHVAQHAPVAADLPACYQGTAAKAHKLGDGTLVVTLGEGPYGVVLAPISWGDACEWASTATWLASLGYRVATFSWGSSRNNAFPGALNMMQDAGGPLRRYAIVGACMGATVALAQAPQLAPIPDAVVAVSPVPVLGGVSVYPGVTRYPNPILLLGTRDDELSTPAMLREIGDAHSGRDQVEIKAGKQHGAEMFEGELEGSSRALLQKFLKEVVGQD